MENNQQAAIAGGGAVLFAIGVGVGYWLGKRRTPMIVPAEPVTPVTNLVVLGEEEVQFQKPTVILSAEEYAAAQAHLDLQDALSAAVDEPEPFEPVVVNVFDAGDWNWDEERAKRTLDAPYVIHRDEYYGEEMGYSHTTLTYYQKDDVLVDEANTPINGYQNVTGPLLFGHGSGDPRTVYIRTNKFNTEYEILLDDGSFAEEVLGLQAEQGLTRGEIKHSMHRMRLQDE